MSKITDKAHVPPELYNYTQPETGIVYKAHAFGLLVSKVRDGRLGNNIPFDEDKLAPEIEADFCSRYPWLCSPDHGVTEDEPPEMAAVKEVQGDKITRIAAAVGIPAADALAKLSKMMGINCASCNHRHKIIKKMRQLGLKETLRQLKETL